MCGHMYGHLAFCGHKKRSVAIGGGGGGGVTKGVFIILLCVQLLKI